MIAKELSRIDQVAKVAWTLVEDGEFRNARRMLKKIRGSYCVSESDRVIALIEAKILAQNSEFEAAKNRILQANYILWGSPDGLEILSYAHPITDDHTEHYYIEVLGGLARFGMFAGMSEDHIGSFDVLANSVDEALRYIDEICRFDDPTAKIVLTCARKELGTDAAKHRGVFRTYPFRRYEEESAKQC